MSSLPLTTLKRLRVFLGRVRLRVAQLQLAQTAAYLAFLSLLALVPIFTIAVSLLGATPILARLRDALLRFLAANLFLPSFSEAVVRHLNLFAAKASQLSLIGAVMFFATAFTALLTIDQTLNRIWQVRQPRPLARRLTLYWIFLSLGPLMLAATLAINALVVSELFGVTRLPGAARLWLTLLPWVISWVGLTLLYRLVPNAPVRWRDALAGALLASLALELLELSVGQHATRLPTYTVVYGAFAALPLFLLWLYLVWSIVLAGAALTASLPAWASGSPAARAPTPERVFEQSGAVLRALVESRRCGEHACQAGEFRTLFAQDPFAADAAARRLCALGYLQRHWRLDPVTPRVSDAPVWQEWWMLAPGAPVLSLRPLFEYCWRLPLALDAQGQARDPLRIRASSAPPPDLDRALASLAPASGDVFARPVPERAGDRV
ncbi:MAG: YihY family inner membrane protein [Burkholderiales bacterium]|nr:YihY family inner membrane protein [Burkholderiales bacterium]